MAEEILETIVTSEVHGDFRSFFIEFFKSPMKGCSIEEFSIFFLNFIRTQTDEFLRGNSSSACNTPRKLTAGGGVCGQLDSPSATAIITTSSSLSSMPSVMVHNKKNSISVNKTTTTTPNLSGNGANTYRNSSRDLFAANQSSHIPIDNITNSSFFDDSLQLNPITTSNRTENMLHKSWNRSQNSYHQEHNDFDQSTPKNTCNKSLENQFHCSTTSTPVRKANRSNADSRCSNISNSGSGNKSKSVEKSNSKKSPGNALCLGDFIVTTNRQKRKTMKEISGNEGRSISEPGKSPAIKLKRRVVPTPINSTTNAFTSPVFRSENNILGITNDEITVDENCKMLQERAALKSQITAIAKEFKTKTPEQQNLHIIIQQKLNTRKKPSTAHVDITKISNPAVLDKFIEIHSILIDMNLTTNVLNEFSYILNLFNAEEDPSIDLSQIQGIDLDAQIDPKLINKVNNDLYTVLKNLNSCIYFALGVLRKQKHFLALLDVTTLRVIIDNERLKKWDKELREFLTKVYSHKVRLESTKSSHEASFRIRQDFNNVFYQQENDTRSNFPSDREFSGFKRQRDMFYTILKTWECKHLNPAWNFAIELGPKVYALLMHMENPINMAHLAKLFTSQLIISSNFTHSPTELEIVLPNVDLDKLTKLRQRLVTPSHFSTDYQFPGNQAFFKDFLVVSTKSLTFIEQLKIALVAELVELNDSSYEIVNLLSPSDDGECEYNEYVVRPEIISTMRILSKFLGLATSLPFTHDAARNFLVDNRQIELRNLIQPTFDSVGILRKSIIERKLIITIPWLVQYISMLDYITLRLTYYRNLIQLLYELYINLSCSQSIQVLQMRPTSIFILRSCLGWLFDHPNIPDDYYKYRQRRRFIWDLINGDIKEMSPEDEFRNIENIASLEDISTSQPKIKMSNLAFDPLLENVLNVACPFLADFRVSIMPTKVSKSVSRTGRYRHITTKISEATNHERASDSQTKLSEAFLHSQSISMRKIVEFVIERTTSAVIKDFQMEILIPSKTEAMNAVLKIESLELREVSKQMYTIFEKVHTGIIQKWNQNIFSMIETRVQKALDALLPKETLEAVKRTCTALVIQKCKIKTEDWRISNLNGLDFYSKDITIDAEKFIKNNGAPKQHCSTLLQIDISKECPSKVFEELQFILHFSSRRPNLLTSKWLHEFCLKFHKCLQDQVLPTSTYRISGVMTVHLVQNLIRNRNDIMDDALILEFVNIWLCEGLKQFVTFPDVEKKNDGVVHSNIDCVYNGLLPTFFVRLLGNNSKSFERLTLLLVHLVKANLITIDHINERVLLLFKENWPEDVLKLISIMLDAVRRNTSANDDEKSKLFMEMLADFSRDLEEF